MKIFETDCFLLLTTLIFILNTPAFLAIPFNKPFLVNFNFNGNFVWVDQINGLNNFAFLTKGHYDKFYITDISMTYIKKEDLIYHLT